jgi:hypothetical protein
LSRDVAFEIALLVLLVDYPSITFGISIACITALAHVQILVIIGGVETWTFQISILFWRCAGIAPESGTHV